MAPTSPINEKMLNLPLLCVETIFKFTPTSKLTRLCSIAVPLPGAWTLGLETVLKKRLPLSLRYDFPLCLHACDVTGAKIAAVKKPEALRFSPTREFIETLPVVVFVSSSTDAPVQFLVQHGDALLSHLPSVIHLELVLCPIDWHSANKVLLEPCLNLKHLLPQLQSFFISNPRYGYFWNVGRQVEQAFHDFVTSVRIDEMVCLRRMALPVSGFECLMRTSGDGSNRLKSVLAGLSSLVISHWDYDIPYNGTADRTYLSALNFVSQSCKQISQLKVEVHGEFRAYLAAFRELPHLTSLALDVCETDLTGLTCDGRDAIGLVSHLRVHFAPFSKCASSWPTPGGILKIASFFPNVKAVEVMAACTPTSLELATWFFGQTNLFPVAAKLGCFYSNVCLCILNEHLMQFLANPRLPEAVDLSQIIFHYLGFDSGTLTAIYCVMQSNSIKSLLLSGPMHRETLPRLQGHIDLKGENNVVKVSAWKDRDLGDQPPNNFSVAISEQTDCKIVGRKTSGNLKGDEFTIRVFHQVAKQESYSWYFSMI